MILTRKKYDKMESEKRCENDYDYGKSYGLVFHIVTLFSVACFRAYFFPVFINSCINQKRNVKTQNEKRGIYGKSNFV